MNNGTSLKALSDDLNAYSGEHSTLDYFQQPLPAPLDQRLDEAVEQFMTADAEGRETFQQLMTPATRALFGIYGHRTATRAIRENRPELLRQGLAAAIIANYVIPDNRRVEVGLAIYYHTAVKLGLRPPDLFAEAAVFAPDDLANRLVAFGNRDDITLKKYGWKEINSPDGIQFRFDWK